LERALGCGCAGKLAVNLALPRTLARNGSSQNFYKILTPAKFLQLEKFWNLENVLKI
jgi:hypothetical protein